MWKLQVILNLYQIQYLGEKIKKYSKHQNFKRQHCPKWLLAKIEIEYQSWFVSLKIVKDLLKVSF